MKGSNNEVEIYPGTHHGFAFPKRPVYNRDAAERIGTAARALSPQPRLTLREACRWRIAFEFATNRSSDADDVNRIAVAAFGQFRDQYADWPAMLAGLSKTSSLSAAGEVIVAAYHDRSRAQSLFWTDYREGRVFRSGVAHHSHADRRPSRQGPGTRAMP